jgi:hypothetical protein
MLKFRISIWSMAVLLAGAVGAQEAKAPAAPGFDAQACARHCQEMAVTHQKMMDAQKAMMEKQQAAWKDIQTQLDAARKARGEKKVAALESVLEKLIAFHGSMQKGMGDSPMMGGMMMSGHGGMMGCCGEAGMGMAMGTGMPMDCPMMKGTTAQPATKPAN